jgi:hypothetical protein
MINLFFIILTASLFIYYIFRIIKKKKNPVLNGAGAAVFGIVTWIKLVPFLTKFIGRLLE